MKLIVLVAILAGCGGSKKPELLPDLANCQLDSECESGVCGMPGGRTDLPGPGPICIPRRPQ